MPSTITHTYFTLDVYQKLPVSTKERIADQKEMLKIFGQSMDPLFFYNIMNFHRGKRIRQFGLFFHEHQTQTFFVNLINYIKYNHYGTDAQTMAFLYGMICHYVLDSTLHPYIIYKTGGSQVIKDKVLYQSKHIKMEVFLDNYMLFQREGKLPYQIKSDQFCFPLGIFQDGLKEVIDYSFKETFDVNNMSKFYEKAIRQMRLFYRYFRNDRYGLKKTIYQVIDKVTPKKGYQLEPLSYHLKPQDQWNYLNQRRMIWNHPINKKETYRYSYIELYMIAINRAVQFIEKVNEYIFTSKKISLKKLFPNISYITGKNCEQKRKLQYFESKDL